MEWNMDKVELLAKIEKILEIPTNERLTRWYGDYAIYEPCNHVTMEQIEERIQELSNQLQKQNSCKVEIKETLSRVIEIVNPENIDEAINTVMNDYNKGNIVLDADDFQSVEFNKLEFEASDSFNNLSQAIDSAMEQVDFDIEL